MSYKPQNAGIELVIFTFKWIAKMIKKLFAVLVCVISFSCNEKKAPKDEIHDLVIKQRASEMADSMIKKATKDAFFKDTIGTSNSPVKILSARPVEKEYSSYKDVRLSWKNVSKKTIAAIRFR